MTRDQIRVLNRVRSRHGRRKTDLFLCEGLRCCREALLRRPDWLEFTVCSESFAASPDFAEIAAHTRAAGAVAEALPDTEFCRFPVTETPQGIMCILRRPPDMPSACAVATRSPFVLILDRVSEPGNMGTILRTAWAAGLREVWYTAGTTDAFGPKAVRAGMGAQFALTLRAFPDLRSVRRALLEAGFPTLWCAVPRGGIDCFDGDFDLSNSGIVVGNEVTGIDEENVGRPVTVPMPGSAESINVAMAATVLLYDAVRRGILPVPEETGARNAGSGG